MQIFISVPEETLDRVTPRARELGVSRSELFSRAVVRYLDELDRDSLVAQIDAAIAFSNADASTADAVDSGRRRLADGW